MKKSILALFAFGAFAVAVFADPIQIAYSPVTTQPANNGDDTVKQWAITSIATFNTMGYPGAPVPTDVGSTTVKVNQGDAINPLGSAFGSNVYSITLNLTGYQYIVLSWGGSDVPDDRGTADYLYYVNGTGSWTFFNSHDGATGDGAPALASGDVSSITAYGNNVPDSGATVGLLGLGLIAVGLLVRRQKTA
ncbi:MAG: VPDSG-CTERM sorting domain-containing protein [Nibricoccus sp.]